ncbi:XRE family transcriptional regulator [Nonomuraea angiospora]|uniref:XRE family transcriptional regulator n=1 Tax=Nonomuraea angiospora TaxID=46172 RepID=UPI00343F2130
MSEADLWPEVAGHSRLISGEVRAVYQHRHDVPQVVWRELFASATDDIGILAYSGLFLAEDASIMRSMAERAREGVKVRVLLGDPDSPEVAARGTDENIGPDVMAARIRNALALYRPLYGLQGIEIRLHATVLYNSIYRADHMILVNTHAYGIPAAQAPVTHLQADENEGSAAIYLDSFERVWTGAKPYTISAETITRQR